MIQHDFQVIHYMYICSIFIGIEKLKDREYLGTVHNLCLNSDYAAAEVLVHSKNVESPVKYILFLPFCFQFYSFVLLFF
jgi:hypothetical protein